MLDRAHTVEVRFGQVYQDRPLKPHKVAMPRPLAWGIVIAFAVSVTAMVIAPFVPNDYRVPTGLTAAFALLVLFALVGIVRTMRGER